MAAVRVEKKSALILPGAIISCQTNLGDQIAGEVMGYDEESKAVIVKSTPAGKPQQKSIFDITIVNLNLIDEANFHIEEQPYGELPVLPEIDRSKIDLRLKKAKGRIGIGVTKEAQQLFDFIRKTIQECQWDKQNILVLDEVEIVPPYKSENCCMISGKNKKTVDYIKNIVNKFHAEFMLKTSADEELNDAT